MFSEGRDKGRLGSMRRLGKSSSFTHLRSTKPRDLHYDYHVVALTSSTYGLMKLLESDNVNEHLVSVIGGKQDEKEALALPAYSKMKKCESMPAGKVPPKTWTDMAMQGSSRFKLEQIRKDQIEAKFPLNPKIPEESPLPTPTSSGETETINTWELMEGLDDQAAPLISPLLTTTTVNTSQECESLPKLPEAAPAKSISRSRSLSAVDGLRTAKQAGIIVPDVDSTSSVTQISSQNGFHSNRGSMDFSSRGSMDFSQRYSGPLSSNGFPMDFTRVDYSGPLSMPVELAQRFSGPLSSNVGPLPSGQVMGFPVQESYIPPVFPRDGSIDEGISDSNLFDPDILATFQDLVSEERISSDDDWCHIDGEASTSGSTADDDSPIQWAESSHICDPIREASTSGSTAGGDSPIQWAQSSHICDAIREDSHSGTYGPRRMSFAKVAPMDTSMPRFKAMLNPLLKYEERCPPGGDNRVVLYLTSLRGIRKTFEDCHSVRMILQSFPVWVDERDVSMHQDFRNELKELVGGPVIVPRVFIKGRYIGGSDEVRRLHEDGKLRDLLKDLPVVHFRKPCDGCGGVRFVPCPQCSGSCKVITEANVVAQCPDCNENGLSRCPVCF